jgi:hypothetical protein
MKSLKVAGMAGILSMIRGRFGEDDGELSVRIEEHDGTKLATNSVAS